jgi:hypothetical protein
VAVNSSFIVDITISSCAHVNQLINTRPLNMLLYSLHLWLESMRLINSINKLSSISHFLGLLHKKCTQTEQPLESRGSSGKPEHEGGGW